jgi:hypothetical protein
MKNYQLFTLRVFVLRDDLSERINRVIRGFAVYRSRAAIFGWEWSLIIDMTRGTPKRIMVTWVELMIQSCLRHSVSRKVEVFAFEQISRLQKTFMFFWERISVALQWMAKQWKEGCQLAALKRKTRILLMQRFMYGRDRRGEELKALVNVPKW